MRAIKEFNLGVVDVADLNNKAMATQDSFSIHEVRKTNLDWETSEPRPSVGYPMSKKIEMPVSTRVMKDFSINKHQENWNKSLTENVYSFICSENGSKHMFCIHYRSNSEAFYCKAIFNATKNFTRLYKRKTIPRILVMTDSSESSEKTFRHILRQKRASHNRRNIYNFRCDIQKIDGKPELMQKCEIAVDSGENLLNGIESCGKSFIRPFVDSVKVVVVCCAEKLMPESNYYSNFKRLNEILKFTDVKYVFMYKQHSENALDTIKLIRETIKGKMFVEIEKPRIRPLFNGIKLFLTVPAEEVANRKAAEGQQNGREVDPDFLETIANVMTPKIQRLSTCMKLIYQLREDRQKDNNTRNRNNKRRERILVVTNDHVNAIWLTMFLRQRTQYAEQGLRYNTNRITIQDSVEEVEKRNCEFRHGELDVLVIDWRSIQSVMRGTVDSIIFFDPPPAEYFQTIMETEMENLISMNCVRLKIHMILDQTADINYVPRYLELLKKYKQVAPQWFKALYEIYRNDWYHRHADSTIQAQDSENTLQ